MKTSYSTKWKASKKPGKQRKYALNAPLHTKRNMVSAHLSKDLKTKYKMRSIPVRTGDSVKVVRGQFRKKTGKVNRVNLKTSKIFIDGIETLKKDGSKTPYPMHPSNIIIETLELSDKKRKAIVEKTKQ